MVQDVAQLLVVILHKIAVHEARATIEQVTVRFGIENIQPHVHLVLLNMILDDERHVAEWQRHVIVEQYPVVVLAIDSMTSADGQVAERKRVFLVLDVLLVQPLQILVVERV